MTNKIVLLSVILDGFARDLGVMGNVLLESDLRDYGITGAVIFLTEFIEWRYELDFIF